MKQQRVFNFFGNFVPYYKDLRLITHSALSSILAARLQYLFEREGNEEGFFKFLKPCGHPNYRQGESWSEELGFSEKEFHSAFENIGVTYDSKANFEAAKESKHGIFAKQIEVPQYDCTAMPNDDGKTVTRRTKVSSEIKLQVFYFCRFVDKKTNLTWYLKNYDKDILTDALTLISATKREKRSLGNAESVLYETRKAFSRERESQPPLIELDKSFKIKELDSSLKQERFDAVQLSEQWWEETAVPLWQQHAAPKLGLDSKSHPGGLLGGEPQRKLVALIESEWQRGGEAELTKRFTHYVSSENKYYRDRRFTLGLFCDKWDELIMPTAETKKNGNGAQNKYNGNGAMMIEKIVQTVKISGMTPDALREYLTTGAGQLYDSPQAALQALGWKNE